MAHSQESIFRSAIRSLVVTAFAVIGIGVGFIPAVLIMSSVGSDAKPHTRTSYEIVPDAVGKTEALKADSKLIAKISIEGIIGADITNSVSMRRMLAEISGQLFDEGRVKAILLEINTPGGTVFDADSIYHQVSAFKQEHQIPVFAYVNGLCASGGMYVAAAADRIYATDVSIVGSVGVVLNSFLNLSGALDKLGIQTLTLSEGKGKDVMNPLRPWQPGEEAQLQELTRFYYKQFVDIVVANRPNLDRDRLVNEFGAHMFPAPVAKEHGFIDASGVPYNKVLEALVEAADLDPDNYQVVELESRHWWDSFMNSRWGSLLSGKITHEVQWVPGLDNRFLNQPLFLDMRWAGHKG